jgi:hypothetical protein
MPHSRTLTLAALALFIGFSHVQAGDAINLFDGKTLTGWTGNPDLWSVQDGVIAGSTMETKTPKNSFLILDKVEVTDFTLTLEAKLEGQNNSGVQYRSKVKDAATWSVIGYQADMHPNPAFIGMLYGEGLGRGIIAKRGQKVVIDEASGKPKVTGETTAPEKLDLSEWHSYTITAKGNNLVHKVDGKVTVDITDNHKNKLMSGIIALQVHAGKPMKASFRNLKLVHLK